MFKKYTKEYPDNFMHSRGTIDEINACIICLENNQCDQNPVDNVYESMCETVKVEMRDKLDSKTITLHSGLSNKRRRIPKLGGLISFHN